MSGTGAGRGLLRRGVAAVAALGSLAAPFLLTSGSPSAAAAPAPAAAEAAGWTMMVYAVGDTENVAQVMVENLAQLTELPEMRNTNVVVLLDLPDRSVPGAPSSPLVNVGRFETAKMLLLRNGGYEEIADFGEISMGRPDVLSWFITEAARLFPAEKYGLTLYDHGGAWTGGYADVGPPEDTDLSVPEIRDGMLMGMQNAGIDRFDLLFHAACLMSNYEAVTALAPLAESMAGSEEVMFQYPIAPEGLLPLGEGADGDTVGTALIEGYGNFIQRAAAEYGDATLADLAALSVVDGDEVPALDAALTAFAEAAIAEMDTIAPEIARARASSLEFLSSIPGYEDSQINLVDLGDFLRQLQNLPPEVEVARDAAYEALDRAVTHQVTGRATEQATGLSVYLPTTAAEVDPDYFEQAAPPGWGDFVTAFLEAGASAPGPAETGSGFTDERATVEQIDQTGILVSGQLGTGGAADVVASETQVFAPVDGEDTLVLVMPAYVGAGEADVVQGVWDYSVTVLTDGRSTLPVTAAYQGQSGGLVGSFYAQYESPEGDVSDVGFRLLLSSDGQIESVNAVDVTDGSAAGIELRAGGQLRPYLARSGGSGFEQVLSDQSIRISRKLSVDFARYSEGTPFTMSLVVSDVGGNVSAATVEERVR